MMQFSTRWCSLFILIMLTGCSSLKNHQSNELLAKKVAFDLKQLDADGLYGDHDGKMALSYEFCIPADINKANEVLAIDPSAVIYKSSPGRISCNSKEYLVMGDTFQKDYLITLKQLTGLNYIKKIVQVHFE